MKKFRFSLRSVATLRGMRESERREMFSTAVRGHASAEEALALVNARIAELEGIIVREREGRFRAADQIAFMQSLVAERTRRDDAMARVAEAKAVMERERQAWLTSRRDLRLVEILESKARGFHRQAAEREQQALLDDRTNALFARAG